VTTRRPGRAVLPILLLAPAMAAAQQMPAQERFVVRGEFRWWWPGLEGQIQKGVVAVPSGDLLDLTTDLGIPDKRTWEVRGTIRFASFLKLRGSYTDVDYDGSATPGVAFTYGATRFLPGQRVVTSQKGAVYTADLEFDFVKQPQAYVGATVGAKLLDLDTLLVAPDSAARETDTNRVPSPSIGLTSRVYARHFSFETEISGLTMGDRGKAYEIQGTLRFHLSDHLAVSGGYRRVSFEGTDGATFTDFKLRKWFAGVELSL
jgi:hypothetical protein